MSASELRQAASLMRERAQKVLDDIANPRIVNSRFPGCRPWIGDAEYIRSMHPAVALAVADWLDVTAAHIEEHVCEAECPPAGCDSVHAALAVARAYLGTALNTAPEGEGQ